MACLAGKSYFTYLHMRYHQNTFILEGIQHNRHIADILLCPFAFLVTFLFIDSRNFIPRLVECDKRSHTFEGHLTLR